MYNKYFKYKNVFVYFLLCLFVFFIFLFVPGQGVAATQNILKEVSPYLLPNEDPLKAKLDRIFSKSRVLLNIATMKNAGFINPKPRKFTHIVVTSHPKLRGYIVKAYLDAQLKNQDQPEHHIWISRIRGAEAIRQEIAKHQWEGIFKVPKKWIYAVPQTPNASPEYRQKHFILVEEDMGLLSSMKNKRLWKNVSPDILNKVFIILETLGLRDCAKPDNIPFSEDGRIAFVDTQTFSQWPVSYKKLTPYLSIENRAHWKDLIKTSKSQN